MEPEDGQHDHDTPDQPNYLASRVLDEAKRRLDEIWDDLFAYNAAPRAPES
jgi:hypothetical protein